MQSAISLRFIREARLTSDLIAWFSAGTLSHVDAITPDGLLGSFQRSVHNIPSGVQVRQPGYVPAVTIVEFNLPVQKFQYDAWLEFLWSQIGSPYDMRDIYGFVFGQWLYEPGSWICSELQAAALIASGIVPKLYLPPQKITPVALALALSVHPDTTWKVLR